MADFKVQTFKVITGSDRPWTNDWYVGASNLGQAVATANLIHDFETAVHFANINFTHDLVSPWPVSGGGFTTVTRGDTGERAVESNAFLPLFNTVRLDLSAGVGRPSPKYLRLPIAEIDQDNGMLASGTITLIQSALDDLFDAVDALGTALIQSSLADLLSGVVFPMVQMRQLHRKRKRTPAP